MMRVLLESAAPTPTRLISWTSGSVATHGVIAVAGLWLTLVPSAPPGVPTEVEHLVYTRPVQPPPARPDVSILKGPLPRVSEFTVPPVAVPRVTFPDYIPTVQTGSEVSATRIVGDSRSSTPIAVPGEAPFDENQVEQVVRPRAGNSSPRYPSRLRAAGVEGDVLLRFVVDTLGRVEPGSVEIRVLSHALFADAVREWIVRTRYHPATIGGRPVRQLVEQRVGFTLRQ